MPKKKNPEQQGYPPKKRINVKKKGDRFENTVAKMLSGWLKVPCYRTQGSGAVSKLVGRGIKNRTSNSGDVKAEDIPILIECKDYASIHLTNWFHSKPPVNCVESWWKKAEQEAIEFKSIPLLICKEKGTKPVLFMTPTLHKVIIEYNDVFSKALKLYGDFNLVAVKLEELFLLDKDQFISLIVSMQKNLYTKSKRSRSHG